MIAFIFFTKLCCNPIECNNLKIFGYLKKTSYTSYYIKDLNTFSVWSAGLVIQYLLEQFSHLLKIIYNQCMECRLPLNFSRVCIKKETRMVLEVRHDVLYNVIMRHLKVLSRDTNKLHFSSSIQCFQTNPILSIELRLEKEYIVSEHKQLIDEHENKL